MGAYFLRRVGFIFVTLIFVSIIGFIIIELPPGSFLDVEIDRLRQQGGDMSLDQIIALEDRYGVNDPLPLKYWKWASGFVRGDFGMSFEYHMPVKDLIFGQLGYTVFLSILTLLFNWITAIVIGVYSATHRRTLLDYSLTVFQFVGLAIPSFLLGLIVMVFIYQVLGWDVGGMISPALRDAPWNGVKIVDFLKHLIVPVIVIGANGTAWLSRVMRSNLLDVLNMQYVQTARSKGVSETLVIWKHAVRNSLHPLIMVFGMSLPNIISGATIVSMVLNLPTIGPLYFHALLNKDMYLAVSFLMFLAIFLLVGNLLADLLLVWVDPRIRYE
ncbi:MAG: ABC transporter permease [Saprospiraceae bacterium]|nr:ABC transporter permease [Saprospiraceae bacterium]